MLDSRLAWLAAAALALSCTKSHPAGPPSNEARAPVVSVATPPPAAPVASATPSAAPPARTPAPAAAHDAGHCEPLRGADVVRRGSQKTVQAKTPAECTRCKGDWGRHGLAGVAGCLCRTPDAGKPCESPHDCVAECLADPKHARDQSRECPRVNAEFHGHCSEHYVTFGCSGIIVEKPTPAGPLRAVQYLCVD